VELAKLFLFELKNLSRIKWLWIYLLLLIGSEVAFLKLTGDVSKVITSMLTITLIVVPVIASLFGVVYYYDSQNFVKLLVSQPIERWKVILGRYLSLGVYLSFLYFLGVSLPLISHVSWELLLLISAGVFLSLIFSSLSFLVGVLVDDRAKGVSLTLILWLYLTLLHDGFILSVVYVFKDYPLEKVVLALTVVNPVDLARILVVLKLDIAALLGLTGTVFKEFFSSSLGVFVSLTSLTLWFLIPLSLTVSLFNKKDL